MTKVIVEFQKNHGRYVKGDVAGFPAEKIADWPKGVCKPYDPTAKAGTLSMKLDASEAQEVVAKAQAKLDEKIGELDAREADLAAREAALVAREAEVAAPADQGSANLPAGAPPKQGAKK